MAEKTYGKETSLSISVSFTSRVTKINELRTFSNKLFIVFGRIFFCQKGRIWSVRSLHKCLMFLLTLCFNFITSRDRDENFLSRLLRWWHTMWNHTHRRQTHHRLLNNFRSPRLFHLYVASISGFLCHVNMENAFLCYNDQLSKTLLCFFLSSSFQVVSLDDFNNKVFVKVLINKKMKKVDEEGLKVFVCYTPERRRILNMFEPLNTFSFSFYEPFFSLWRCHKFDEDFPLPCSVTKNLFAERTTAKME